MSSSAAPLEHPAAKSATSATPTSARDVRPGADFLLMRSSFVRGGHAAWMLLM